MTKQRIITRSAALLLILLLAAALLLPGTAHARSQEKTVRVGWHEEPYFIIDQYGRRSGYSYEYQCKVAAYTGWNYEYVEGSWSDLLRMLKDGEIDLLSDVSYMPERAESMLYASLPMGTESYYVFVSPGETEISAEDLTTLNGKRVGVTKDSIQSALFRNWAEAHDLQVELLETTDTGEDSLKMLGSRLDAFVTMDVYGDPETAVPIVKIGSSDFYFAVSKSRPDLLMELDTAMNRIQDENKYYNQQLHEKYLRNDSTDRYLSISELEWLSAHGPIRVGYQDNYLAFCAKDEATGELTGALKDYLAYASNAMENTPLDFEAIAFPTAAAAIEAMMKGEVDCVFPANLTDYDGETMGVVMSPPLMRTEMDAVVRAAEQKEFVIRENVTVAVNQGNTNYDLFLADRFPTWNRAYFVDTPAGLEAVAAGEADCVIISSYRYNNISRQCEKLHLTTVYTGVDMDFCFAIPKGELELYSILARVTNAVPAAAIHTSLTYYSSEDVKTTFMDLIKDNLGVVLIVVVLVFLLFLMLLLRSLRAEKLAREEEHKVNALNKRVFVDALTSVRNKGAYNDYLQNLQEQLEKGEIGEFAVGVFDCDDLKKVNDQYGHDKGDLYLKAASSLICQVFQHSPVFRIGGDEFAVVLQGEDYQSREALVTAFEEKQRENCEAAQAEWDEVHVSQGIAVYDPAIDTSVNDTARRADKIMYGNKRSGREVR